MKKILITGASGFIGRQCLTPLLEKGFEVHALSRKSLPGFKKDVVWHCQNLLDEEKTRRLIKIVQPSHCLHLAWYTEPGTYSSSPDNLLWTAASIKLLRFFQQQGGQRFVGAGTCVEYDWRYGYCSEAVTPIEPATLYGICKSTVQKILASFSESTSLSSAWGRVFFLYGPYENPTRLAPAVIISLLRGELALCSLGDQLRDYMHVSDAANSFVCLLDSEVTGPVNIASGKPILIKDFIYKIAEQLNGFDKIRLGALPTKNKTAVIAADVARLNSEVGYNPKFNLVSGLEQTINWWKRNLSKKGR
jgi:nucleoside-diphosphate-sugar epimerase